VNPAITLATARRILAQLRHDHRTVALIVVVPSLLMVLLRYVFQEPAMFDRLGPMLLGLFPFVVMFVVTSVATLRERTGGTLERLMSMPLGKLDLLLGYALAFGAVAVVQGALAFGLSLGPLGLDPEGPAWLLFLVAVADGLLGTALGLFVSAFAATEFQAVQFLPAFLFPQLLLCGLFVPRGQMAPWLAWISDLMPLSYAVDAMERVTAGAGLTAEVGRDLLVVGGSALLALALGAATLRRRTG
jgi:ABC-2 type transport system permease protein